MKVLVTGAGGFLGRHVVAALTTTGCEVVAMLRQPAGADQFPVGTTVVTADLRTSALDEPLAGVDAVVHLAAQVTGSDEARFSSTVVGTERLLSAVRRSGVSRFVLVSSYSVYDWQQAGDVLEEGSPTMERPYGRDGYTVAKVWQERLVRESADGADFEITVLRPGFIWGPTKEDIAGAGLRLGSLLLVIGPRMRLPLTYVVNCAEAVALAAVHPRAADETFNIVDGAGPTAWRYARMLSRLDPGIRLRVPVPYALALPLVTLIAWVSGRLYRYGGKLPGAFVPASFVARFLPVSHTANKARSMLGWTPVIDYDTAEVAILSEHR